MAPYSKRKVFIISRTKEQKIIINILDTMVQGIIHTCFYMDTIPTCYIVLWYKKQICKLW